MILICRSLEKFQDKIEMVRALSQGNQDAFRFLFLSYFPKVKAFITHLLKDEPLAEDLSQDIFVKLWENRDSLGLIQSFDAYVYRMAKNSVINQIKRDSYGDKYSKEEYLRVEHVSMEEEIFAKEIQLLVELTVNKMPEQRKKIYRMSRVEGLKNDEIADKLNLSKKTIENHLNLALKEIRKTISLFLVFFI